MTRKFTSDIDIDVADRQKILDVIPAIPAAIHDNRGKRKHNSGIYPTTVPVDPTNGACALDYIEAGERGYVKLDLLNVGVYQQVRDEEHLQQLMKEPNWKNLYDPDFCAQLIHVGNHHATLMRMPEPVDSIPRLAMFLSVIRPAKRHLIGLPWARVAETVWEQSADEYGYKQSHAISYAQLVAVHMNLLEESSEIQP